MVLARNRISTLKQRPQAPVNPSGCPCARPCSTVDIISPLMETGEPVRFRRGEVFWQAGALADRVLVVCSGLLKLTRPWEGREMILDLLHRGQMAGEETAMTLSACSDSGARGNTFGTGCVALSGGRAILLSRARLQQQISADPSLMWALLQSGLRRSRRVGERIEEVTAGAVQQRLARVLLRLSGESGLDDARGRFVPIPLRRGDLADLVACRVETVIRIMTDWQRREIIETHREGFVIRDLPGLRGEALPVTPA